MNLHPDTRELDSAVIMAALTLYAETFGNDALPPLREAAQKARGMADEIDWGTVLLVPEDEEN